LIELAFCLPYLDFGIGEFVMLDTIPDYSCSYSPFLLNFGFEAWLVFSKGFFMTGCLIVLFLVMSPRSDDSMDTLSTDCDCCSDWSKPWWLLFALGVVALLTWPWVLVAS